WSTLPLMDHKAFMDVFGVVFGLGFVLSFGYWCTDFVLIQRALTAKSVEGAVKTPLIAAVFKLVFPWLVIFPGMSAAAYLKPGRLPQFDQALPLLISRYYGYALMGLGISAILASLMSGLAGNITAFSTLCTHDLYQSHLRSDKTDAHYLRVGRIFTALAACLSVATAYIVLFYNNLMDYLQLVFSTLNAPIFAVFLLGMFTTWATPTASFYGLLFGVAMGVAHNVAIRCGAIQYGSQMVGNFYGAVFAWAVSTGVTAIVSSFTTPKPREDLEGVTYFTQTGAKQHISRWDWMLALAVMVACVVLNIIFR
ncbi:MAG TPA: hypothetical protein VHD85_07965, partial [Terracidiphilus sp.]|nr:hypothetical protein [Terracidiphilus sp.]